MSNNERRPRGKHFKVSADEFEMWGSETEEKPEVKPMPASAPAAAEKPMDTPAVSAKPTSKPAEAKPAPARNFWERGEERLWGVEPDASTRDFGHGRSSRSVTFDSSEDALFEPLADAWSTADEQDEESADEDGAGPALFSDDKPLVIERGPREPVMTEEPEPVADPEPVAAPVPAVDLGPEAEAEPEAEAPAALDSEPGAEPVLEPDPVRAPEPEPEPSPVATPALESVAEMAATWSDPEATAVSAPRPAPLSAAEPLPIVSHLSSDSVPALTEEDAELTLNLAAAGRLAQPAESTDSAETSADEQSAAEKPLSAARHAAGPAHSAAPTGTSRRWCGYWAVCDPHH